MDCSYCKQPTRYAFVIDEQPASGGPKKMRACFPCISAIGEKIMRAQVSPTTAQDQAAAPTPFSLCVPCPGCGGIRRENCKDYPKHQHDWCDCQ